MLLFRTILALLLLFLNGAAKCATGCVFDWLVMYIELSDYNLSFDLEVIRIPPFALLFLRGWEESGFSRIARLP
jgi:hypothetical protein